jgi:hypothetical protein
MVQRIAQGPSKPLIRVQVLVEALAIAARANLNDLSGKNAGWLTLRLWSDFPYFNTEAIANQARVVQRIAR